MASFLPVIERCDNFNLAKNRGELVAFCLSGTSISSKAPVGLLWPEVVDALSEDNMVAIKEGRQPSWTFRNHKEFDSIIIRVHFASHITDRASRSAALAATCTRWRDSGKFSDTIGGRQWRDELYPIYESPFREQTPDGIACEVERAAAALFGIVTYGVHMTVFRQPALSEQGETMIWVPTRAKTKQTWPGFLDNTVAGGIPAGMMPFEALVKESMEEASLAEDIVRTHARSVGAVSYFFQKGRWLQPEVEYIYDLEIPSTATEAELDAFRPQPLDGEVEAFEFLPLSEVISRMHKGLFKPNCALILVDFLVRHGHITPESEPLFMEIITRLHGRFDYGLWAGEGA